MPPEQHCPGASGPLNDIRVLDFGTFISGTFSAMLMGDMGADAIKVEPLFGDPARTVGPFLKGESHYFQGMNRNKRSIAVDMSSDAGREIVYELVRGADVLTENFRPGVMKKLKLDYETLRKINPRLIYSSTTGFGSRGPLKDHPAYDGILQAMSGISALNAVSCGRVATGMILCVDFNATMLALSSILAALYHREKTNEGQLVETSLLQSSLALQAPESVVALDAEKEGTLGACPYRLFETSDGGIFVGATQDKFWRGLCDAIERPDLGDDAKYATNPKRVQHMWELFEKLEPVFRTKTSAEWERRLLANDVPCGIVYTYEDFFLRNPQVQFMEMNPIIEHPTIGRMHVVGVPFNFEKTPGAIQRPAPLLGQHTEEILREIGFNSARIGELLEHKVVKSAGKPPPVQ